MGFWNCIDIRIEAGGGVPTPASSPPVTPVPTPIQTPMPTPIAPTPTPMPTPSADCSSTYDQCGGNNWGGPTCCQAGSTCQVQNEWYSQCVPGSGLLEVGSSGSSSMDLMKASKKMLREDPMAKEQWYAYVEAVGGGFRDPTKHDRAFLQTFITKYKAGERL